VKVIYTAAHAGAGNAIPIGGGGAIATMLEREWSRTRPFELVMEAPPDQARDIVRYNERDYADFCFRFRHQTTTRILSEDPSQCVVLSNDISEGPDFELLARHGYRVYTIWHVDVVAFVARMYLKGFLRPETLTRIMRPFEDHLEGAPRLAFTNQAQCVRHGAGQIVMTERMKQTILKCYPGTDPARIHVVPWGALPLDGVGVRRESNRPTLLTLSRISPEKGQHRLLEALRGLDREVRTVVAGDAAFMGGEQYLRKLKSMGADAEFVGHLSGQAKLDAFASADVYIFPSVSESYGLTLMEALSHGLPVIAWDHDGARAIIEDSFGMLVRNVNELRAAIRALVDDPARRRRMGEAARAYAAARPFHEAADRVAQILLGR
jgi:glycosyltransferase involved in cell wall biosynthesis